MSRDLGWSRGSSAVWAGLPELGAYKGSEGWAGLAQGLGVLPGQLGLVLDGLHGELLALLCGFPVPWQPTGAFNQAKAAASCGRVECKLSAGLVSFPPTLLAKMIPGQLESQRGSTLGGLHMDSTLGRRCHAVTWPRVQ